MAATVSGVTAGGIVGRATARSNPRPSITVSPDQPFPDRLVASPCCLPKTPLTELLPRYRELGFTKFEGFSRWAEARLDFRADPRGIRRQFAEAGFRVTSFHLPPVTEDAAGSLADALAAARFAAALGEGVKVLFKASSKEVLIETARPFLDAVEAGGVAVVPVLQNHLGSAISSLEDYREVLARIADPRMQAVLEVGHFQRAGVDWRAGWELLEGRIALIHVNDIRDGRSVHFGTGQVDFPGLMKLIKSSGYTGDIVVELELENAITVPDETLAGLKAAINHLTACYEQA
jgi:sugar phosphate isomerase/epimerase